MVKLTSLNHGCHMRHSVDYSSSDLFSFDDSSETSSDSSSDDLFDSSFALSSARADLLPPPKRIGSFDSMTDLEDCLDESSESFTKIDKCIAYADALIAEGIYARVVVEAEEGAVEVTYETLGDRVQRFHVHTKEIPVHRVQVIKGIQRDQGQRIVATGQQSAVLSERINELERDNTRLRSTLDVAS
ncbi:hypothetical protein Tco_1346551 [Tanacetum coccineum]